MHHAFIAWFYVVVLISASEAASSTGTWLGALFTLLLYGALPLGIEVYVSGTRARRKARRAAEQQASTLDPDRRSHAAADAIAAERKEP